MKTKIIIFASALALLAAGCNQSKTTTTGTGYDTPTNTTTPMGSASTTINSQASMNASATDNSDASISKDMSNIDTQMNGLNSDSASADQSLNERSSAGNQ